MHAQSISPFQQQHVEKVMKVSQNLHVILVLTFGVTDLIPRAGWIAHYCAIFAMVSISLGMVTILRYSNMVGLPTVFLILDKIKRLISHFCGNRVFSTPDSVSEAYQVSAIQINGEDKREQKIDSDETEGKKCDHRDDHQKYPLSSSSSDSSSLPHIFHKPSKRPKKVFVVPCTNTPVNCTKVCPAN
eukprot:CAMPEP_0117736268 /NCGR_PEP_ID=MMETSP0947-20121206/1821_1 /TAXON_ID=44440 /ORGANISM="Chattonella subsalsa, Strain CCMP2191" /LENGTH=186 /DNA_ID=CAMNT_0005551511 /DNA_START=454 /DNA_END=1014 /DNA_ORIENTATION=-